jgi:hypothetical protein
MTWAISAGLRAQGHHPSWSFWMFLNIISMAPGELRGGDCGFARLGAGGASSCGGDESGCCGDANRGQMGAHTGG